MTDIIFLSIDDVFFFHHEEMKFAGGKAIIRDRKALCSAVNAPKATFHGKFLMDIFEMAATYANSICFNHPFLDGNKRAAAISAIVFLSLNGYEFTENNDEELADIILDLVQHKIDKAKLANYFHNRCKKRHS